MSTLLNLTTSYLPRTVFAMYLTHSTSALHRCNTVRSRFFVSSQLEAPVFSTSAKKVPKEIEKTSFKHIVIIYFKQPLKSRKANTYHDCYNP